MLKTALEAEGIPSALHNENMTNLYGGLISAFTGVDIFVYEKDLERAKKILNENNNNENQ